MGKSDSSDVPQKLTPDFATELALIGSGSNIVAGVDEAGRGPLAGPVVVAAVVLDPNNIPAGLNDSKKLSAKRRDELFSKIISCACCSIISVPPSIIKSLNIRGATLWGMSQALRALPFEPDHGLIDGRDVPEGLPCPASAMVKGDSRSVSIAAASILAKVTRDRMCLVMDAQMPDYGFSAHKGYGTARHMTALQKFGATAHHRADFAPVAKVLAQPKLTR